MTKIDSQSLTFDTRWPAQSDTAQHTNSSANIAYLSDFSVYGGG
jgi:hypothetical protein